MATVAHIDTLALELGELAEIDTIYTIETRLIGEGPRIRPVDPVWAQALGELMLREGQDDPIDIARNPATGRWELHGAGGHRRAGALFAEIESVKVKVHHWNPDAAELREINDTLKRRELDPIDRANFVARAVEAQKRLAGIKPGQSGRVASAQARWQRELKNEAVDATVKMTVAYGWTKEVAEALGYSVSSVERDLLLARRLSPSLVQRLREVRHPILTNASQLRALAKLDEEQQAQVVSVLLGEQGDAAKTVSEALGRLRGANRLVSNPADKRHSAFIGGFARMGLIEKKGALHELAPLMPKGFHLLTPSGAEALGEALSAAFKVLTSILDSEPVSEDDAHDAAAKVQQAMIDLDQASDAGADE